MSSRLQQWIYKVLGPTTVHLQHEFLLWLSMTLLIVSSFSSQYRDSVGTTGDLQFIVLVSLWLGRNLFIKWLCTSETSSHRSPTLSGVLAHWMTSHFLAGQYFDRPKDLQTVAKQVGTHHSDDARTGATISSFFLPSILFTWQWIKLRLIGPIWFLQSRLYRRRRRRGRGRSMVASKGGDATSANTKKKRGSNNSSGRKHNKNDGPTASMSVTNTSTHTRRSSIGKGGRDRTSASSSNNPSSSSPSGATSGTPNSGMSLAINQAYSTWSKVWSLYGPPLQLIIPLATLVFFIWYIAVPASQEEAMHALTMTTRNPATDQMGGMEEREFKPYGGYIRLSKPKWSQLFVCISCGGTLATIGMYMRVVLPIADLVAGTNVLKAVRNESKLYGSSSSSGKSRKVQRENSDVPFAEQQKPVATENRFRLICKVAGIKLVENLFVCALLPRTGVACRATGHCPEGASLMDLSKIFFPAGVSSALREDAIYPSTFAFNSPDKGAAIMTILSTVLITWTLLISQAATLNRSYLGIMGYIAGEWIVVDQSDPSVVASSATNWDPRRRYKKGDLIAQSYPTGGQSIYKATSNSPEGRPFDLYLRATHDIFRNELGHPATSQIVAFVSGLQLILVYVLIAMIFVYQLLDYHYTSLMWTLAANLIAAVGVSCVMLPDYRESHNLAQQINK